MLAIYASVAAMSFGAAVSQADVAGFVTVKSAHGVKQTVARLESEVKSAGASVIATVDHAAGAAKVGGKLRPTVLVIFGNPKLGTPILQCAQTAGIDLPVRALVWEDDRGDVWLGYDDPAHIADRHGAKGCDEAVNNMATKLGALFRKVAGS
jgi:uncharacterized protein (DUF302 family)